MEILRTPWRQSIHIPASRYTFQFTKLRSLKIQSNSKPGPSISIIPTNKPENLKVSNTSSSSPLREPIESSEPELEANDTQEEKFDWFSQWYPVMPVCDLVKRVPRGKKVMGLDVVVWRNRNEGAWKVFDDACPHGLAPLSEGRIDQCGRLQCVYHGWCFNGSGDCKFIPQAPPDGPPVHTSKKATVYPSTLHHEIVWLWPNADPQYQDIIMKKKPPFILELDDPSFVKPSATRDIPRGEGGRPLELSVRKLDINGYVGKHEGGGSRFLAPCIFYLYADPDPVVDQGNGTLAAGGTKKASAQRVMALVFICVPVSPGNSRFIAVYPRNFATWMEKIFPRWIQHLGQNLALDSDLCLLHLKERKIMDIGIANWQKACFLPTKAGALVVGYRRWLNKYAGGQVDRRGKYCGALPPIPPREQLMDRYWSHVVNCSSCLNALEVILEAISIVSIGIVAATKEGLMSAAARNAVVVIAAGCFAASRWLAHFIYKNFRYHDYDHAFPGSMGLVKPPF